MWIICLGWPWTTILLISAFQVARLTGVSTGRPAWLVYFLQGILQFFHSVGLCIYLLVPFCLHTAAL
jgi:hypothetical protein